MPDDNLPAVPADCPLEEMVFEGDVVDEAPAAPPARRLIPAPVMRPPVARVTVHAVYVAQGAVVAWTRWRASRTRPERMQRMAELAGDAEIALKWAEHRLAAQKEKRARRESRREALGDIVRAAPGAAVIAACVMLGIGLSLAYVQHTWRAVEWPWLSAMRLVALAWEVASLALAFGPAAVALGVVAWLHHLGRTAGLEGPGWIATSADGGIDVSIDEVTLTKALVEMRFPQLTDYHKQGLPLQFLVPCRQEGRGTYFEIRLPHVAAEKVVRRRADFAAGLYRLPKEVWPSVGSEASVLKGWIADKGALEEGAGPYPLLSDGTCDVFKGVPFGRTLRGDPVLAPLMERNTLTGGMPGQGKSSAARVIMCGAALDPTAELWIMIPDTNFDFERMKRRCSRYVMGAEDEKVELIRDWLSDLRDEVQARGQLLIDHEVPAVTRRLASAGVGLHPLLVLLEEAHIAITHKLYGKEISGLLTDIVKLGRKRGIHVIVSTQAPTKDSMPRDVTRNCSNGIAFAVGDHVANDALLGQGAYAAGHRATELIPGADRGTALVKGFSGERSEMVQVYFLDVSDGHDEVTPVIDRAMAGIERTGRGLPGSIGPVLAIERRSLLADLAEVTRGDSEPVRLSVLAVRLKDLAPRWDGYRQLTGVQLQAALDEEGVRWTNTGNVPRLDPADLPPNPPN